VKKLLVVLGLLALLAAGVAYFLSDRGTFGGSAGERVEFAKASPVFGDLYDVVGGSGFVQPQETLVVSTELGGRVVMIGADFNDRVESGDVLVKLDDRLAQQKAQQVQSEADSAEQAIKVAHVDLERATSQRDAAQAAYDEMKRAPKGTFSEPQIRVAKLQLDAATAAVHYAERTIKMAEIRLQTAAEAVKLAQIGVDLSTIRVPYVERRPGARPGTRDVGTIRLDGPTPEAPRRKYKVLDRKIRLNQMVGPPNETQLFTLAADLDQVDLQVQVSESDIGKVRPGQKVYFTVSAYQDDNRVFTGEVVETRLLPTVQQGAVFYSVLVTANNPRDARGDGLLRPGMTTSGIDIVISTTKDGWLIPNTALDFQLDPEYQTQAAKDFLNQGKEEPGWVAVWILDGDTPKPVWVKPKGTGKIADPATGGLRSEPYTHVEWDPSFQPQPKPGDSATYPRLIIGAPPVKKTSWFGAPLKNVIKF
jgi:HlyD family secretion protein